MSLRFPYLGGFNHPGAVNDTTAVGYLYGITLGAGGIINAGPVNEQASVVAIGNVATYAPTAAQSGTVFLMNRAAGSVVTLPAPVVGLKYTFVVTTSVTSNAYKVITDAATTLLQGLIAEAIAGGAPNVYNGNASTHISVNMNGTTTGGLVGTRLTFECVASSASPSGLWEVSGFNLGSGTIATPFATS